MTILKRQSAAMLVVCSCQSCRCYRYLQYLQQEKRTLSPLMREVRNEKELTKSASVIDLAVSYDSPPPNEHDDRDDIHQDAVLQQPLLSLGNEQAPGAGRCDCSSRRLHARIVTQCAVRTQP